jgi:hypothetical protein
LRSGAGAPVDDVQSASGSHGQKGTRWFSRRREFYSSKLLIHYLRRFGLASYTRGAYVCRRGVSIAQHSSASDGVLATHSAIYFGAAPPAAKGAAQPTSGARESLQALKALQSVTTAGVSYRDYATRVLDAKVKVDQFVQSSPKKNTPARDVVRVAMRYYELASQAWSENITNHFSQEVGHILEDDPEINACPAVKEIVAHKNEFYAKHPERQTTADTHNWGFTAVLYGTILYMGAEDGEALRVLTHAHELKPDDGSVRRLLAEELSISADQHVRNQEPQVVALLEKAAALQPDSPQISQKLAEARRQLAKTR